MAPHSRNHTLYSYTELLVSYACAVQGHFEPDIGYSSITPKAILQVFFLECILLQKHTVKCAENLEKLYHAL